MKSRLMKTISPITEEARYIILSSLTDLPFLSRPVPNVILQLHAVVLLQVGGDNLLLLSSSWTKYQKLISIIEERYLSDTLWNIIMQYLHLHKIFRQRFLPLLWNNVGRHVELYCLDPSPSIFQLERISARCARKRELKEIILCLRSLSRMPSVLCSPQSEQ